MNLKAQIPNLLTLSNLLCGAFSVFFITQNLPHIAALLILAGAFLDFFDGLTARALGVSGDMGKELDSLADVITFGLAPSFIALYYTGALDSGFAFSMWNYIPMVMAAFSAYRLAKFNIDTRQTEDFIGVPTPANALFWLGFPLIVQYSDTSNLAGGIYMSFLNSVLFINIAAILLSVLLVAEIRMMSMKFKSLKWGPNRFRFILLGVSAALILLIELQALPIILLLYILLSLIENFSTR